MVGSWATIIGLAFLAATGPAQGDEPLRAKAAAPEKQVELRSTLSGSYFITKPLKDEYNRLLDRLRTVQGDVTGGRLTAAAATQLLGTLNSELDVLRKHIEAQMVFVPVAHTQTITETVTFPLGAERCLVITADNVRLVGWDRSEVKCELEKTVLTNEGQAADGEFKALALKRRQGLAPDKLGRSTAEATAEEARYLASAEAGKLSEAQRGARKRFIEQTDAAKRVYTPLQGRAVDAVEIEGLTYEQGNRQMSLELESKDGGKSSRSVWRRHGRLTVYVPACQTVAVRGGQVGLDVSNVQANLILTSDDAHDRDYHGEFKVRGVRGSLTVKDAPLDLVEDVEGNVVIHAPRDFANSGVSHDGSGGQEVRTMHRFRPRACTCKNVRGNLEAWFGRVDLTLEQVTGRIDVRNEFGDTKLIVTKPLANVAHRIVSESGRVEVEVAADVAGQLGVWAMTNSGNVRTNASREVLDSFQYVVPDEDGAARRAWSGFRPAASRERSESKDPFDSLARPTRAYHKLERRPGLDLVSRGGSVVVNVKQPAQP